jgi:NAD(P)-dependent dehydrogenase (short-subunit alcohol dehydrogenase family)
MANAMGVDLIEPQDVSDAVLWLLSDQARYVTGTVVPVDSGLLLL